LGHTINNRLGYSFAEKLEISKQYLCDLERGRRFPSVGAAAGYARKLGYTESQFVRLCLQDMVDKEELELEVTISALLAA
jgi:transcriptional regulator with XRE-family HTH domain